MIQILTCAPGNGPKQQGNAAWNGNMTQRDYESAARALPMSLRTFTDVGEPRVFIDTGVVGETQSSLLGDGVAAAMAIGPAQWIWWGFSDFYLFSLEFRYFERIFV